MDVEAQSVTQEGYVAELVIATKWPYFYFKPVLLHDGTAQWSRGENLPFQFLFGNLPAFEDSATAERGKWSLGDSNP